MSAPRIHPLVTSAASLALLTALTGAAHPGFVGMPVEDDGAYDAPPERRKDLLMEDAIVSFDPEDAIMRFSADDAVENLGDLPDEEDAESNMISLSTDILFRVNSWELPESADDRIADLVEEIPDGASVRVVGHTDSAPTGEDFDNQELSENRAEAVADVLTRERPDLELDVTGLGDTEPAVTEDEGDEATFAANRRVEIIYGD